MDQCRHQPTPSGHLGKTCLPHAFVSTGWLGCKVPPLAKFSKPWKSRDGASMNLEIIALKILGNFLKFSLLFSVFTFLVSKSATNEGKDYKACFEGNPLKTVPDPFNLFWQCMRSKPGYIFFRSSVVFLSNVTSFW
ncbi:hypothetical protein RHMOL_Rhmol04G0079800 [Rhododendron molle]|uniref:Uncharacterized protein n=1 Tax=Rhododendron molle TaxID=49168 RepID=A0ACC0NZE6_RHOML|nr:hypothetical protein RHMOL_Rhmol04G0079800 [Rhododendron molle]